MARDREIFEQIVEHERRRNHSRAIEDLVVLGLLHYFKWDHILERMKNEPGASISPEVLAKELDGFTKRQIADFSISARNALLEYARRHPPRHEFWYGVAQSLMAWFLGLVITLVIVKTINIDLASVLGIKAALP